MKNVTLTIANRPKIKTCGQKRIDALRKTPTNHAWADYVTNPAHADIDAQTGRQTTARSAGWCAYVAIDGIQYDRDPVQHNTRATNARISFAEAKRAYEDAYMVYAQYATVNTEYAFCVASRRLAQAITYSVLKKCIDTGYNPLLVGLRATLQSDINGLYGPLHAGPTYDITYNRAGERVMMLNPTTTAQLNAQLDPTSDAADLLQTAQTALFALARRYGNTFGWLDQRVTITTLARRVYVSYDAPRKYKTDVITPIQSVYRAVRSAIMASRAVACDPRSGYAYIADLDTETHETFYYRSGRYANIAGDVHAKTGARKTGTVTHTGADGIDAYTKLNAVIAKMGLTDIQAAVLQCRLQGMGLGEIAERRGVSKACIQRHLKMIQAKAQKVGLVANTQ